MHYTILTVGSKPDATSLEALITYQNRMSPQKTCSWQFITHGKGDIKERMKQEAVQLLSKINPQDYVILLDERGKQLSSEKFAHKLASIHHKTCVFIIGGAYGVDDSVRERADFVWSLSELVFPHQLVRLILAEQLYRAHCIQSSHPYHHS